MAHLHLPIDFNEEDEFDSSHDSELSQADIEQNTISFYMVDDHNNTHKNDRNALIQKTVLLQKLHKKKEYKVQQASIGWNLLFEIFFSKFFLIQFSHTNSDRKMIINLREIEFRIRKEIGKNVSYSTNQQLSMKKKSKEFSMFNKYEAKPPVSTWFEYNILNERLIDEDEKENYVPEIFSSILSIQPNEHLNPVIRRVATALSEKKRKSLNSHPPLTKKKTITLDLTKFSLNEKEGEGPMSMLLTSIEKKEKKKEQGQSEIRITKKEKLPYGLSKKSPHILKLFAFPKSVFNLLGKFEKKFEEKGYTIQEAEEELTNIQNDQKVYEIELRKNKLYLDDNLNDKKYLFDFRHLNNLFENQRNHKEQPCNFLMKAKLEKMMKDIDRIVSCELNKAK